MLQALRYMPIAYGLLREHDRFPFFIFSRKGAESRSGFLGVLAALRETVLSRNGPLREQTGFASQLLRGFIVHPNSKDTVFEWNFVSLIVFIARLAQGDNFPVAARIATGYLLPRFP